MTASSTTLSLRTLIFVLACALSSIAVAAAPWSDDEIKRRFAHGVDLSAHCHAESLATKRVTGADCVTFSTWLANEFPALMERLPGVMRQSPDTTTSYVQFVEALEAITDIGELSNDVDALLDKPRLPL
jgi:hypothetical protein